MTETKLLKSEVVLEHKESLYESSVFFSDEDDVHCLDLPEEKWEDMGKPEHVTVTIEPGDKLNA